MDLVWFDLPRGRIPTGLPPFSVGWLRWVVWGDGHQRLRMIGRLEPLPVKVTHQTSLLPIALRIRAPSPTDRVWLRGRTPAFRWRLVRPLPWRAQGFLGWFQRIDPFPQAAMGGDRSLFEDRYLTLLVAWPNGNRR